MSIKNANVDYGVQAFGNFDYTPRPKPEDRQRWFVSNLASSLRQSVKGELSRTFRNEEIDSIFKIDPSLDDLSVGRMNIMMSQLCCLPKGRELINELIKVAEEKRFQIKFQETQRGFGACFPKLDERGQLIIPVHINFGKELNTGKRAFARLCYDKERGYSLKKMVYPPFIILAHELTHSLHHIKNYAELRERYPDCPNLDASSEEWKNFTAEIYKESTGEPYPSGLQEKEAIQIDAYTILTREKFKNKFGFSFFLSPEEYSSLPKEKKNVIDNAIGFWVAYAEEEALTIAGDGQFSDGTFLEQARDIGLLKESDGFEPGSIFRWGHGFYEMVDSQHKTLACLDQENPGNPRKVEGEPEFNNCIRLFEKVLPDDLK